MPFFLEQIPDMSTSDFHLERIRLRFCAKVGKEDICRNADLANKGTIPFSNMWLKLRTSIVFFSFLYFSIIIFYFRLSLHFSLPRAMGWIFTQLLLLLHSIKSTFLQYILSNCRTIWVILAKFWQDRLFASFSFFNYWVSSNSI